MPIKKPMTIPIIVVTICLALSFGFLNKTTKTLFIIIFNPKFKSK